MSLNNRVLIVRLTAVEKDKSLEHQEQKREQGRHKG